MIIGGRNSLLDVPRARIEVSEAEETALIRRELGKLYRALYGEPKGAPEPGSLRAYLYDVSR